MRAVMGRKLLSLGEDEVRALMKNNRLQCDFFSSIRQPIDARPQLIIRKKGVKDMLMRAEERRRMRERMR